MLNDSTVCTDTSNVVRTAAEIRLLKAQKEYLKERLLVSDLNNDYYKEQLKQARRTLFRRRLKVYLAGVGGVVSGYSLGRLLP
jgi:hypothetical protein